MFYRCCGSAPDSTLGDMEGTGGKESLNELDAVV